MKQNGTALNRDAYLKLEKPSEREPVRYYANVETGLYQAVLNMCAAPGKMCMNEMMHIDMMGGAGVESHENREKLKYDDRHAGEAGHGGGHGDTVPASGVPPRSEQPQGGSAPATHDGHSMPGMNPGTNNDNEGAAPPQLNNN